MKLTTENFIELLEHSGITYRVCENGTLSLTGHDSALVARMRGILDKHPEFQTSIVRYILVSDLREYLQALSGAGVAVAVTIEPGAIYTLNFTGGKYDTIIRLMSHVERNKLLHAAVILSLAVNNSDLLSLIQERACIRWCDGFSDSLFMAVLSGITPTGETQEQDRPKTDWNTEIQAFTL